MAKQEQIENKASVVRQLIPILIVVCLISGCVMLIRAYFLQNPLSPSADVLGSSNFPENRLQNIDSAVVALGRSSQIWGSELSGKPGLRETEGIWLQVHNGSEILIGELMQDEYTPIYPLPSTAENIQIFPDGQQLFILPPTNVENARLIAIEGDVVTEVYKSVEVNDQLLSGYFDAESKQFFISEDTGDGMYIKSIRPNGTILPIFEVSDIYNPRVIGIEGNTLFFTAVQEEYTNCYALDLITKGLTAAKCNQVQTSNSKVGYTTNPDITLDAQGHILQTNFETGAEKFLSFTEEGQWFDPLVKNNELLSFVFGEIVVKNGVLTNEPKELRIYDTGLRKTIRKELSLPEGKILQVGTIGDKLVVVTESSEGRQSIVIESEIEVELDLRDDEYEEQETLETILGWEEIAIPGCSFNCTYQFLSN